MVELLNVENLVALLTLTSLEIVLGIDNVIFLSTDIHAAIINDAVSGTTVRELVAGAIGMDPIFRELPPGVLAVVSSLPGLFPSISYFDIDRFTVATATVTSTQVTTAATLISCASIWPHSPLMIPLTPP